jgi:hypothetical protein
VKKKFEDLDSNESRNTFEDGLKSVTNSMSNIAQALAVANENFIKSNIRVYSAQPLSLFYLQGHYTALEDFLSITHQPLTPSSPPPSSRPPPFPFLPLN